MREEEEGRKYRGGYVRKGLVYMVVGVQKGQNRLQAVRSQVGLG